MDLATPFSCFKVTGIVSQSALITRFTSVLFTHHVHFQSILKTSFSLSLCFIDSCKLLSFKLILALVDTFFGLQLQDI